MIVFLLLAFFILMVVCVALFFGCISSILVLIMLAILFAVATWLILYAGLVLIVFYLIFIFWRWLLEHHPKLSKKLGLYIVNNWLIGVNNGQTKRNVIILFIIVLILIWLVKR